MVVAQKKGTAKKAVLENKTEEKSQKNDAGVISIVAPHKTESGVAGRLKNARLAKKLTILEISEELRIRRDYIRAIEEDAFDALPEQAYTLGFIRSYANFLGFDGVEFSKEYRQERDMKAQPPLVDRLSDVSEAATPSRHVLFISCIAAVAVLLAGWFFLSMQKERVTPEPVVVASTEAQPALVTEAPKPALEEASLSETAAPAAGAEPQSVLPPVAQPLQPGQARLHASDKVWVKVYEHGGKTHNDVVLEAGESLLIPLGAKTFMSTGNAGALALELNGQKMPFKGKQGEVKRHIPLEESAIKEYVSSNGE